MKDSPGYGCGLGRRSDIRLPVSRGARHGFRRRCVHIALALPLVHLAFCISAEAATNAVRAVVSSCTVSRGKFDRGKITLAASVTGLPPRAKRPVFAISVLSESKDGQLYCFTRVGIPNDLTKGEMQLNSPRCASSLDSDPSGSENPAYYRDAEGVATALQVISQVQPQIDSALLRSIRLSGVGDLEVSSPSLNMGNLSVVAVRAELWLDGQVIGIYSPRLPARPPSRAIPPDWHVFMKHVGTITYRTTGCPIL